MSAFLFRKRICLIPFLPKYLFFIFLLANIYFCTCGVCRSKAVCCVCGCGRALQFEKLGVIFVCGTKVAPVKALLLIAEAASAHPTHVFFLSTHPTHGISLDKGLKMPS